MISSCTAGAQLKIDYTHFRKLLLERNYQKAYQDAMEIRKQPYGKCFPIDYIITKCLCESKLLSTARKGFIELHKYPLTPTVKGILIEEEANCGMIQDDNDALTEIRSILNMIVNNKNVVPKAISSGKIGYVLNCGNHDEANVATDFGLKINTPIEQLSERLFSFEKVNDALEYYKKLLGNGYSINISGHFILITKSKTGTNKAGIQSVVKNLEKSYSFFTDSLDMRSPDKLIAVYLLEDQTSLTDVSRRVHGFNLPKENIGYSCLADLSILGTSKISSIGTLYHELFHLIVRADIGDIPGWLDEGVAALFETSTWHGNVLKGDVYNWRGFVINEYSKTKRSKSLHSLFNSNWENFKVESGSDVCDVAVNYAYAKHFAIYLQERHLLKNILKLFKNRRSVFIDTTYENESSQEIVEKLFNTNIFVINRQFQDWLAITCNINKRAVNIKEELYQAERGLEFINSSALKGDSKFKEGYLRKSCDSYIERIADLELKMKNNVNYANEMEPSRVPINEINKSDSENTYLEYEKLKLEIEQFLDDCFRFITRYSYR